MQKLALLAAAGALGSLARYGLAGLVQRWSGGVFPWGTFAVNVLGSFLFGLVWAALESRVGTAAQVRVVVLGGFMGAFTTFSTFMFDTGALLQDAEWWAAAGNVTGQVALGMVALAAGLGLGRMV